MARNPESRDIIPGTGDVRKLRWSRAGIGKRGGARVVYFFHRTDVPIYILITYATAVSTDLGPKQKRQVRKLTILLEEQHGVKEIDMETSVGNDLIESLKQAVDHAKGQSTARKVHVVEVPDVRSLRKRLNMSQQTFSSAYRIPLVTLKNWEQGRCQPDATAAAYLRVIERLPAEARAALKN